MNSITSHIKTVLNIEKKVKQNKESREVEEIKIHAQSKAYGLFGFFDDFLHGEIHGIWVVWWR